MVPCPPTLCLDIWVQQQLDPSTWFSCKVFLCFSFSCNISWILSACASIVKRKWYSETSSQFLFLYLSSYLPQRTHSFPKTNLFLQEGIAKRVESLQKAGQAGDCSFKRFLVREDKICSLVELVLFDLVLMKRFCVAMDEFFCFNFHWLL